MQYSNTNWRIRYGIIAMIWAGVLAFGIVLAIVMGVTGATERSPLVGLGIAAFISAAVVTGIIVRVEGNREARLAGAEMRAGDSSKRKNDQQMLDAASLLTDEDIAELREAVKEDFRRRLALSDDPAVSFEDLLAKSDQRSHR